MSVIFFIKLMFLFYCFTNVSFETTCLLLYLNNTAVPLYWSLIFSRSKLIIILHSQKCIGKLEKRITFSDYRLQKIEEKSFQSDKD